MTTCRLNLNRRSFAPALGTLVLGLSACRSKGDSRAQAHPQAAENSLETQAESAVKFEKPDVANLEKWNFPKLAWIKGEWCPHCREYAQIFSDPEVGRIAGNFELILLDNESAEAAEWRETGSYVPRTLFLNPQGQLDTSFSGPNPRFPYFFSAHDKALFMQKMNEAKIKYGS
jgi:hypothetical protein